MNDPKYATNSMRVENREDVVKILEDIICTKKAEEWLKTLTDAGIPCGPIYTMDKLFSDPQVLHRKMVQELDHPKAGTIKVTGIPFKLSDTPGEILTAPPFLGQHSKEILQALGYNDKDIELMYQEKIV